MRSMGLLRDLYWEYMPFSGLSLSKPPTQTKINNKDMNREFIYKKEGRNVPDFRFFKFLIGTGFFLRNVQTAILYKSTRKITPQLNKKEHG